jgi:hypothetical protein
MLVFFLAYWKLNGKTALAKVMNGETNVLAPQAPTGRHDHGPQA